MAATVGLIKNITEALLGIGEVSIDNFTFQLFYKWYLIMLISIDIMLISWMFVIVRSASFLIGASFLVGYSQYFGTPIHCETVSFTIIWKCWEILRNMEKYYDVWRNINVDMLKYSPWEILGNIHGEIVLPLCWYVKILIWYHHIMIGLYKHFSEHWQRLLDRRCGWRRYDEHVLLDVWTSKSASWLHGSDDDDDVVFGDDNGDYN